MAFFLISNAKKGEQNVVLPLANNAETIKLSFTICIHPLPVIRFIFGNAISYLAAHNS